MFNNCQFTLRRFFDTSFLVTYIDHRLNDNNWIKKDIRIFCGKKRELYSICRNNKCNTLIGGPGSSVGIATDYRLDGPGIESRWGRDF
jgi:hypothetical protein